MSGDVAEDCVHTPLPRGLEILDSRKARQEIDPGRGDSELDDLAWCRQILDLDSQISPQEVANGGQDALRVLASRLDEEVEVLGGAGTGVEGDRVGSYDEISSLKLI